jgi:hypothetical protein
MLWLPCLGHYGICQHPVPPSGLQATEPGSDWVATNPPFVPTLYTPKPRPISAFT